MSDNPDGLKSYNLASTPYTTLADAYCAGGETAFSEEMAAFAIDRANSAISGGPVRVADIACGSGAACVVFAKLGLDVIGIDRSAHMINHAQATAKRAGQRIQFKVQDYRELNLGERVGLVTCMYDSLNFMRDEADLGRVFAGVHRSMVESGVFIFDVYTIRGLAETWGTKAEIHTVEADHFIASQTAWDGETMSNTKTLYGFSKASDGQWHRWKEEHRMRAYPIKQLRRLLDSSGFKIMEVIDWDHPTRDEINDLTLRAVFIARRAS
jgi:SAM-dependent methyltransferase